MTTPTDAPTPELPEAASYVCCKLGPDDGWIDAMPGEDYFTADQMLAFRAEGIARVEGGCVGCGHDVPTEAWCAECRREHIMAARDESGMDTVRLNWLDANPKIVLRSGKQRIRPLIDAAMIAADPPPENDNG